MLHPHPPAEEGVLGVRHVAGGEDVAPGAQGGVDQDAVVHGKPRGLGELRARRGADADHHGGAVDGPPAGQAHPLGAAVALDRIDARAREELDPVVPVHAGVHAAHLAAEDALEGHRLLLDDRDLHPA